MPEWVLADLHHGVDSTLNIVNNEIKYKAEIVKQYGDIPDFECLPSELNLVFMKLLVNAAHAISAERGTITVRTGCDDDTVWVKVSDNGAGIAKENLGRIFDLHHQTGGQGHGARPVLVVRHRQSIDDCCSELDAFRRAVPGAQLDAG